jgi:hypothetical protein
MSLPGSVAWIATWTARGPGVSRIWAVLQIDLCWLPWSGAATIRRGRFAQSFLKAASVRSSSPPGAHAALATTSQCSNCLSGLVRVVPCHRLGIGMGRSPQRSTRTPDMCCVAGIALGDARPRDLGSSGLRHDILAATPKKRNGLHLHNWTNPAVRHAAYPMMRWWVIDSARRHFRLRTRPQVPLRPRARLRPRVGLRRWRDRSRSRMRR